ncbi:alpha/beta fold hydrolase [Kribbella monticola]|uniref:alpha/beta fold hydrolase n=1 Tax=Kribbella monticola TaxID=2185285 RepID=UPI000DD3F0DA|nr:alpha/beta hydrolase [Kribbella monticola]
MTEELKDLVCLHAAGSAPATWDGVRAGLEEAGYRVHCPTLAGHRGAARRRAYRLEDFRDDVVRELDELGLERVTLVGHSLGAFVASLIAVQVPERVERLVLEELPVPPRGAQDGPPSVKAGTGAALRVMGLLGRKKFDPLMLREVVAELRKPQPAWWDGLMAVPAPTLLLAGGPKSHLDQSRFELVAQQMPTATIATVDAGHRIHRHAPQRWLAAVTSHLRGA